MLDFLCNCSHLEFLIDTNKLNNILRDHTMFIHEQFRFEIKFIVSEFSPFSNMLKLTMHCSGRHLRFPINTKTHILFRNIQKHSCKICCQMD